jgi:hypothetical protein
MHFVSYLLYRDRLPKPSSSNAWYLLFETLSINEGSTLNEILG